ncbi:RNA pseudouridylate synthase domain-containing protein 2 isoform X2 [Pimephales promelas]|uniref:RNA pseudouridylate synthase domain-containing protein 2 isoform X2 n=1 Tax=Pimephales promelas TaxID=90988 RepID=UPI0019556A02|nr:RNA pseudouridylate synthase domain-containing protein 2 isoform X2 [Pimephales promelas]KAG1972527.1 pseudouridine synthase family protein [Pimephales promelas]
MAWLTCVRWKVAGFSSLLCFVKRENNNFLRHLYRDKNQRCTQLNDMDTKGATREEDNCDTESTVRTNCAKRKHEEPDQAARPGRDKKRKRGGKQQRPGERYVPPPQKRNPGVSFSQEHFAETSYYFEGGLRKVHPYYFDFKTYCKGRWVGKTLLEVFKSEFRAESMDYYHEAVKEGRIKLNETPVDDLNITLKNNDFLRNTVHRHEPPVSGQPMEVLVDDGEVVVVDKPGSLPVHPCGRFRHNTVIFILGKEKGLSGLHTVHRLDRLTSGVLLFARTLEVSQKLDEMVRERQLEKEYVCRVEGEFPEGEVVCEQPILVVSFRVGLCRVDPKGKESRTVFQRLSYNGRSSVVRCLPLTGRTHQIRVHLQFLGFPILNDPIYGSSAWGPNRAKGGLVGMSDEELLEALIEEHRSKESLHLLDLPDEEVSGKQRPKTECKVGAEENHDQITVLESSGGACDNSSCKVLLGEMKAEGSQGLHKSTSAVESEGEMSGAQKEANSISDEAPRTATSNYFVRDHLCGECKIVRPDPKEKDLIMYLHALRYKGADFEYSTRLPDWAKEDWIQD